MPKTKDGFIIDDTPIKDGTPKEIIDQLKKMAEKEK